MRKLCSAALLVLAGLGAAAQVAAAANPIIRENSRPGTWGWRVTPSSGSTIQGYASSLSVIAGHRLALHVSAHPAARYRIVIYRLGWYGGAGARRIECLPGCQGSRRARTEPTPNPDPATGEVNAHWPVTDTLLTRERWVSGEYLAQLVLLRRGRPAVARPVPFIVRAARELPRAILVEVPVNTWEAYNAWGGKSLYAYNSRRQIPAVKVSFQRPWSTIGDPNETFPVTFEYPMLRFLERTGFPLEYVTDVDVDRDPSLLLGHRLSVTLGHGEYWSKRIRDAWDAARAAGRDLAFLGADTGYWQIRYEDSDRTIVEYRSATADPDPVSAEKTTEFRALDPPRAECALLGVEFQGGGLKPPLVNSYTVVARANPWLDAAGLRPGDVLRAAVSGEWDSVVPGCERPAPTVLLRYAGGAPADATLSRTSSGGRVLALGTEGFGALVDGWGRRRCSVNVPAERFLRAALTDLAGLSKRSLSSPAPACPKRRGHAGRDLASTMVSF